tara:strand:+ start:404 stop:1870 length:1467 start_codon:yes stop_codon:yes gene_type:complete
MGVDMKYHRVDLLRQQHKSWKLLRSDHAALIASFLHRIFIEPNIRTISEADLVEALDDDLYAQRAALGEDAFPKSASEYLDAWADPERAWLRKFYPDGSDEPMFDLTPATEKAITWLESLGERSFVGTESRLLTLFDLLRQINEGSEADPQIRIKELQKKRDAIDKEIEEALAGEIQLLDDANLKERYQQFSKLSRELMGDFREVEQNFRSLDRNTRERIALWKGGKGELLEEAMRERDAIVDSDEGKSFRAFWDLLMSSSRQDELTQMLERMIALPSINELNPSSSTVRLHYDWMEAAEHTQRAMAGLSGELRRFLDNRAFLENRRIMDILKEIEGNSLALIDEIPRRSDFIEMDGVSASIELPHERPLFIPAIKPVIQKLDLDVEEVEMDTSGLYTQVFVDKDRLLAHIRKSIQMTGQASLKELCRSQPLEQGLAELVVYLQLGEKYFNTITDDSIEDVIEWQVERQDSSRFIRRVRMRRFIFLKK